MAETDDVLAFLEQSLAGVKPVATESGGLGAATAVRRYREGFTTDSELLAELRALGYSDARAERYHQQAQLDYIADFQADLATASRSAYKKELISRDQLAADLARLGLRDERIDAILAIDDASLAKRPAAAPIKATYETPAGKKRIAAGVTEFHAGTISATALGNILAKEDMPPELVEATVSAEVAKFEARRAQGPERALPEYETDSAKRKVTAAITLYVGGKIDEAELKARLEAVGMPAELVAAQIELARARVAVKPVPLAKRPPSEVDDYETPAGRVRVATLRQLYSEELLAGDDLIADLRALEMPEDLASAILEQERVQLAAVKSKLASERLFPYKTETGRVKVDTARLRFRRGLSDPAQLVADLVAAGVPSELAQLIAAYELTRAS